MGKDKNEIVPFDEATDTKIVIEDSEKVEKFIRDFFKKNPGSAIPILVPKGENTDSLKLDYILSLLWTINERLDKMDEKLKSLDGTLDWVYDEVDELYDSYLCDE